MLMSAQVFPLYDHGCDDHYIDDGRDDHNDDHGHDGVRTEYLRNEYL